MTQGWALAERPYRILWIGRTVSAVGDAIMPVTLVFAILSLGGTAADIGLVLAVSTAVRALLLVLGGALADRLPRRLLMLGSDTTLATVQVVVGLLLLTGHGSIPLLLVAAVCYGAGAALSKPAITGVVPQMVSPARLQQANAFMAMSLSTAKIVGPVVAGLLAALTHPGVAYLVDAATFAVSATTLLLIKVPRQAQAESGSLLSDIGQGWREMAARPWYLAGLCSHALWNVGFAVFLVLGPLIVTREAGGTSAWGLVATATACGSLTGGVLAASYKPRRPLVVGHLALGLSVLQLAVLIGPAPLAVIAGAAAVSAVGMMFLNEVWVTAMQQLVPPEAISRISSYDWLISFVVAPIAYAATGPASELLGDESVLAIACGAVGVSVLVALLTPGIRRIVRTQDGTVELLDGKRRSTTSQASGSTTLTS